MRGRLGFECGMQEFDGNLLAICGRFDRNGGFWGKRWEEYEGDDTRLKGKVLKVCRIVGRTLKTLWKFTSSHVKPSSSSIHSSTSNSHLTFKSPPISAPPHQTVSHNVTKHSIQLCISPVLQNRTKFASFLAHVSIQNCRCFIATIHRFRFSRFFAYENSIARRRGIAAIDYITPN
jgi:hypothetical protein